MKWTRKRSFVSAAFLSILGPVVVFLIFLTVAITPASAQQQTTGKPGAPDATTTVDSRYLPLPPQKFQGEIGLNALDSKIGWPARIVPPAGAPNILLILTDDVGFGAPSTSSAASFRRPRWTASLPTGCATPISTPPRCARRAAPR